MGRRGGEPFVESSVFSFYSMLNAHFHGRNWRDGVFISLACVGDYYGLAGRHSVLFRSAQRLELDQSYFFCGLTVFAASFAGAFDSAADSRCATTAGFLKPCMISMTLPVDVSRAVVG